MSSVEMYSCSSCFVFRQKLGYLFFAKLWNAQPFSTTLPKQYNLITGFLSCHPLIFWLFPGTVLTSFSRYHNKRSSKFRCSTLADDHQRISCGIWTNQRFQVFWRKNEILHIIWYKLTFLESAYCMHSFCAALCLNLVLLYKSWSWTHAGKWHVKYISGMNAHSSDTAAWLSFTFLNAGIHNNYYRTSRTFVSNLPVTDSHGKCWLITPSIIIYISLGVW